ncbi:MAG: endonuclease III [Bacilli bacterium]|jgi:endonuclease-3|nr:endonuclease III [Bacilli bacterium]MCH4277777.1 endonuclease III [Bacilli bacterium]
MTPKSEAVLSYLKKRFPNAKCTLDYASPFSLLVAISLSAQSNDLSVNKATPNIFKRYPDPESLAEADIKDVEELIKSLGLYHNKAKNIILLSKALVEKYHGEVPNDFASLTELPGVGHKTAGVYLLEIMNKPAIPVDTHVHRISDRLGYSKEKDSPDLTERKLEKSFDKEDWGFLHHSLIAFGREVCRAKNPECERCELQGHCLYFKRNSSIKGK